MAGAPQNCTKRHDQADAPERAYRLALGLEAAARSKALDEEDPRLPDLAQWLVPSELLSLLDETSASLLRPPPMPDTPSDSPRHLSERGRKVAQVLESAAPRDF